MSVWLYVAACAQKDMRVWLKWISRDESTEWSAVRAQHSFAVLPLTQAVLQLQQKLLVCSSMGNEYALGVCGNRGGTGHEAAPGTLIMTRPIPRRQIRKPNVSSRRRAKWNAIRWIVTTDYETTASATTTMKWHTVTTQEVFTYFFVAD